MNIVLHDNVPWQQLPVIRKTKHDYKDEDIIFQFNDIHIGKYQDLYPHDWNETKVILFITGTTLEDDSITVAFEGYQPYFFVTIPEKSDPIMFCSNLKERLYQHLTETRGYEKWKHPSKHLMSMNIVYKKASCGFTNGLKKPFIRFEFNNVYSQNAYIDAINELYPRPKRDDVLSVDWNNMDNWNTFNQCVLCEVKEEETRACNNLDLTPGGWIKMPKGTYSRMDDDTTRSMHTFYTDTLINVPEMEIFANMWFDSFDVEAGMVCYPVYPPSLPGDCDLNEIAWYGAIPENEAFMLLVSMKRKTIVEKIMPPREFFMLRWSVKHGYYIISCTAKDDKNQIIVEHADGITPMNEYEKDKRILAPQEDDTMLQYSNIEEYIKFLKRAGQIGEPLMRSGFPDPMKPGQNVISIAHTIQNYNKKKYDPLWIVFVFGDETVTTDNEEIQKLAEPYMKKEDGPKTLHIALYSTELKMLENWSQWWSQKHVSTDIVFGWNNSGFDNGFLGNRIMKFYEHEIAEPAKSWSRLKFQNIRVQERILESKAYAHNEFKLTPTFGRISVDLYVVFKKDPMLSLTSYSLKSVSEHFFQDLTKVDLPYTYITEHFMGSPEKRLTEVFYNFIDTLLPMWLFADYFGSLINIARVNHVAMKHLCYRGQQIRCYGGFHYQTTHNDFVIYRPNFHPLLDSQLKDCEIIEDEEQQMKLFDESDYMTIDQPNNSNSHKRKSPEPDDNDDDEDEQFILPPVENMYNKLLGFESNDPAYLEKRYAELPNVEYIGYLRKRTIEEQLIVKPKKKKKESKKRKILKAHSGGAVMIPTVKIGRNIGVGDWNSLYPTIMHTYGLDGEAIIIDPKYANIPGVNYLDVRIDNDLVFRFAKNTAMPLVTHTHNLVFTRKIAQKIGITFAKRKQEEIQIIFDLLEKDFGWECPEEGKFDNNVLSKVKEIADRNATLEESNEIVWRRINANIKIIGIFAKLNGLPKVNSLEELEPLQQKLKEKIDSITDKRASEPCRVSLNSLEQYKLKLDIPITNVYKSLVEQYYYESLWASIYNSKQWELKVGGNSTFGFIGTGGLPRISRKDGTIYSKAMYSILPISACITFLGRYATEDTKKFVESKGYKVQYADTDSLFIDLGLPDTTEGFKESFQIMKGLMQEVSDRYPGEMNMEHEKTCRTIIYYKSKMYVMWMFESPTDPGTVKTKGLNIKKRDSCGLVSKLGDDILDVMMKNSDLSSIKSIVQNRLDDLINGKIDPSLLCMHKKLSKVFYVDGRVGHADLAKKINQRTNGQGPKTGEYVHFLYIDPQKDNRKNLKMIDWIEDYDYALEQKLQIDYLWYLENQIGKTIRRVLKPLFEPKEIDEMINEALFKQTHKQQKLNSSVISWFGNQTTTDINDFF